MRREGHVPSPPVPRAMTVSERKGDQLRIAAERGVALVLGSGRRLLDDPGVLGTYRGPAAARPPLLLANLGASEIRGRDGAERAERLVELLDADGLSIHLNALQEAVQPEGET